MMRCLSRQSEMKYTPHDDTDAPYECGALILAVGDAACEALRPGDRLLTINGASATVSRGR